MQKQIDFSGKDFFAVDLILSISSQKTEKYIINSRNLA